MKCFYIVQVFDEDGCVNSFATSDYERAWEERKILQASRPEMNVEIVTEYMEDDFSIEDVDAMNYDEHDLIKEGKV